MRTLFVAGACVAAVSLGLAGCQPKTGAASSGETRAAAGAALSTKPHRKAGLWSQTLSGEGVSHTTSMCIGPAGAGDDEESLTEWTGQDSEGEDNCSKNSITPILGGWRFESVCNMGQAGQVTSTGELKGDFNANYTMKVKTVTTGAASPEENGTHEMAMTGAYEGPCPDGMKPGDMMMPGGMVIHAPAASDQAAP